MIVLPTYIDNYSERGIIFAEFLFADTSPLKRLGGKSYGCSFRAAVAVLLSFFSCNFATAMKPDALAFSQPQILLFNLFLSLRGCALLKRNSIRSRWTFLI